MFGLLLEYTSSRSLSNSLISLNLTIYIPKAKCPGRQIDRGKLVVINRATLLVDIDQARDQVTGHRSVNVEQWLGVLSVVMDKGKTRITLTELNYLNLCLQGEVPFEGSPTVLTKSSTVHT